jgi:hypothetical protein
MGKLDDIQTLIYDLSKDERARLREWFDEYDGDSWDTQFDSDVKAKKFGGVTEKAKQSANDGKFKDV